MTSAPDTGEELKTPLHQWVTADQINRPGDTYWLRTNEADASPQIAHVALPYNGAPAGEFEVLFCGYKATRPLRWFLDQGYQFMRIAEPYDADTPTNEEQLWHWLRLSGENGNRFSDLYDKWKAMALELKYYIPDNEETRPTLQRFDMLLRGVTDQEP